MNNTVENADALRKIASRTLRLSVQIEDDTARFISGCYAVGEKCEEFWPSIENSAINSKKIAHDCADVLNSYSKLMEHISQKILDAIGSGEI